MPASLPEPSPTPVTMPALQFGGLYDPMATHCTKVDLIADAPEPEPTKDNDRFSIIRLFAQGGQGHVFVARDDQLRREVALKELQPRFADRPLSRARFVREAEITGALEHPGVVPVYALGHHEGGRPYYAMRLIQGRNLQEVIQQYHESKHTLSPADRNLKFRQMLQRFVSVCQTIAYAHSRCIVHRDIKPSNVLIGSYGEAVVVDWGLARPFHPTAGCANEPEANMPPGSNGTGSMSGMNSHDSTLMGTALGTPAFMSPEQADGRWDLVGPPADIYSLGTTLYVLFTGKMPIEYGDWPSMAAKIRAGQVVPACVANPSAPKALEAICKKAMALKVADRYPSALALAADVEHWLADEPVAAWEEPWHLRLARWSRRHKVLVVSMLVLVMTAMILLPIGYFAVDKERVVREAAEKAKFQAMNRLSANVIEGIFAQQRGLTEHQRGFLTTTLADYEKAAADLPMDPEAQLGVVNAYRRAGEIRARLGMPGVEEVLAKAMEKAQTLLAQRPNDVEVRRELARVHSSQGRYDRTQVNRGEEAAKNFATALAIREEVSRSLPADLDAQRELAAGYANHATGLADLKNYADAIGSFRHSVRLHEEIAKKTGTNEDTRELVKMLNNLGCAITSRSMREKEQDEAEHLRAEAEVTHERARQIAAPLVEKDPDEALNREVFAESLRNLAGAIRCRKIPTEMPKEARRGALDHNLSESQKRFEASAAQYEILSKQNPNVPEYALEADGIRIMLGKLHLVHGEVGDAKKEANEALAEFDRVLAHLGEEPSNDVRRMTMVRAAMAGRRDALYVLERYADAADACSKLVTLDPPKAHIWRSIRAMCLLLAKQPNAAFAEIATLVADSNANAEAIYNCSCVYAQAARLYPAHAEEYSRQAVALLEVAAKRGYFEKERHIIELDKDTDLKSLHDRADYKKFRESLNKSK